MQPVVSARSSVLRHYGLALAVAVLSAVVAVGGAALLSLPLRDPDGVAGPAWVRLPGIVLLFLAADVLPRAWLSRRADGSVGEAARRYVRERWSGERLVLVAVGLTAFYVTYVSYRNVKGFLPFVRPGTVDDWLLSLDRLVFLGHDTASVLHAALGTGPAAYLLSAVYLAFLGFVPLSLGASLVWARDASRGAWYVTALCLDWAIGAASYYVLPSLGPVYTRPSLFNDLPSTGVSALQDKLFSDRVEVLADPWATQVLHGIGAFASLHVAVVVTAALVAQRAGVRPVFRWALWTYFGLTVVSTLYFGWHYVLDDVAGLGIGVLAVLLAERATGQRRGAPASARAEALSAS